MVIWPIKGIVNIVKLEEMECDCTGAFALGAMAGLILGLIILIVTKGE